MGKSDNNLYRSLVESRGANLDYMVDVQEVSDFSTSKEDEDDKNEENDEQYGCNQTEIKSFRPKAPITVVCSTMVKPDSFETSEYSSDTAGNERQTTDFQHQRTTSINIIANEHPTEQFVPPEDLTNSLIHPNNSSLVPAEIQQKAYSSSRPKSTKKAKNMFSLNVNNTPAT